MGGQRTPRIDPETGSGSFQAASPNTPVMEPPVQHPHAWAALPQDKTLPKG
jgi:hypothetical protein